MRLCCGVKTNQRQQILAHDHQTQSKLSVCLLQGWLRPGNPRSPEAKSCLPSFSLRERGGGGGLWPVAPTHTFLLCDGPPPPSSTHPINAARFSTGLRSHGLVRYDWNPNGDGLTALWSLEEDRPTRSGTEPGLRRVRTWWLYQLFCVKTVPRPLCESSSSHSKPIVAACSGSRWISNCKRTVWPTGSARRREACRRSELPFWKGKAAGAASAAGSGQVSGDPG